jgi:hypothetical protein
MVQRCVNPCCREELRLLNAGDLYAYGRGSDGIEFFWLCAECASKFDLCLDPTGRVSVRPRSLIDRAQRADPAGDFRLISRTRKPAPRLRTMPSGEQPSSLAFLTGPIPSVFNV